MKRSEMLENIEEELKEIIDNSTRWSTKRYPHAIKNSADRILAMLEGFGMTAPMYRFEDGDIGSRFKEGWEQE